MLIIHGMEMPLYTKIYPILHILYMGQIWHVGDNNIYIYILVCMSCYLVQILLVVGKQVVGECLLET